ncbi:hypothetical protein [Embleya sp. NPDC020630]|uniref:hypothetical protein n=1 Tax=Embleya sp. NPDC020630 TaxID=3363979 RepID=UPI00379A3ACB
MDVSPFVDRFGREFAALARTDSGDAVVPEARLLEPVIRRMLFDTLAAAADEINRDFAPGAVEIRLREGEPYFAVLQRAPESLPDAGADGATARVDVRVSRHLKESVEQAAGREGRSVQDWVEQVLSGAVRHEHIPGAANPRGKRARQRYTAWAR